MRDNWGPGRKKTNLHREDDMNEKEVCVLIDKSNKNAIEMFKLRK